MSACPVSACPVSASSLPTPRVGGGRGWGACAVAVSGCLGLAWRRQDCRCGSGRRGRRWFTRSATPRGPSTRRAGPRLPPLHPFSAAPTIRARTTGDKHQHGRRLSIGYRRSRSRSGVTARSQRSRPPPSTRLGISVSGTCGSLVPWRVWWRRRAGRPTPRRSPRSPEKSARRGPMGWSARPIRRIPRSENPAGPEIHQQEGDRTATEFVNPAALSKNTAGSHPVQI